MFFLLSAALAVSLNRVSAPADLIVLSAKIWTGDPSRPDAQALAVRGGRIASVGSNAEIELLRGPDTRILDAKGRRVVPGFIDSHTHAAMAGFDLLAMDLRHTKDPAEFTKI